MKRPAAAAYLGVSATMLDELGIEDLQLSPEPASISGLGYLQPLGGLLDSAPARAHSPGSRVEIQPRLAYFPLDRPLQSLPVELQPPHLELGACRERARSHAVE